MESDESQMQNKDNTTPKVSRGIYNPVTVNVHNTVGAIFLGLLSIILLNGWMKCEARQRNRAADG